MDSQDLEKVKNAYRHGDVQASQAEHTPQAIRRRMNHPHAEQHTTDFKLPEIILGGQDGLVNVLGIILGVAAATSNNQIVIVAGLAATFAESVSMAAVAYTSKLAEADYYQSEYEREKWEIENAPEGERDEIRVLYEKYGFKGQVLEDIVKTITSNKEMWLRVMMEQELELQPVERKEAIPAAITVGLSALVGSFIPLTAFFFFPIQLATTVSLVISALTLFIVGYYKAKKTIGRHFIRQGMEMMIIGMVSAFVGYIIGVLFQVKGG